MTFSVLVVLVSVFASASGSKNVDPSDFDHVAVIPDIHGDASALIQSLYFIYKRTTPNPSFKTLDSFVDEFLGQMQDSSRRESNPIITSDRVLLVQLGDIAHREKDSLLVYEIMYLLDTVLKWKVISLVGNHEIMAHLGQDAAYVHAEEHIKYGGTDARLKSFQNGGLVWNFIKSEYGLMARLAGPRDISQRSPSTLFVHAGVEIEWFNKVAKGIQVDQTSPHIKVDNVNEYFLSILDNRSEVERVLMDSRSPLWSRSFLNLDDKTLCDQMLPAILKLFEVARIIVGHSANSQDRTARQRCNGRIFLADFAMSRGVNAKKTPNPGALLMTLYTDSQGNRKVKYISELHSRDREKVWLDPPKENIPTQPQVKVEEIRTNSADKSTKPSPKKKWYKKVFNMFGKH